MKWIAAILAAGFFVGCGVGANDPEGLAASGYDGVGSSQQALTGMDGTGSAASMDGGMGMLIPCSAQLPGAGPVSSPQDPIPTFEAHPLPVRPARQQAGLPLTAPSGDDPRPTK